MDLYDDDNSGNDLTANLTQYTTTRSNVHGFVLSLLLVISMLLQDRHLQMPNPIFRL